MSDYVNPQQHDPELTPDRLNYLARGILTVFDNAKRLLSTELDDNYTMGTVTFGRCRQWVIQLANDSRVEWLKPIHQGMDYTVQIGQTAVRFFKDVDSDNPKKSNFFRKSEAEKQLSLDFVGQDGLERAEFWRFVLVAAEDMDDDDEVFFVGYSANNDVVAKCKCDTQTIPVFASVSDEAALTAPPEFDPELRMRTKKDQTNSSTERDEAEG